MPGRFVASQMLFAPVDGIASRIVTPKDTVVWISQSARRTLRELNFGPKPLHRVIVLPYKLLCFI